MVTALGRWWKRRQDRRRWVAETLITAALRERPDQSGYPLARRTGLGSGRLYTALARMETDGRITGRWAPTIGPDPRRRTYRLTDGSKP